MFISPGKERLDETNSTRILTEGRTAFGFFFVRGVFVEEGDGVDRMSSAVSLISKDTRTSDGNNFTDSLR